MLLVDVHAHLDFTEFDADRKDVIARCEEKGVRAVVCNATTIGSMKRVQALSEEFSIIKPAFGIYPSHTIEYSEQEFENALDWIRSNKPFAIGEIGLDYKEVEEKDRPLMEERFRIQLRLAKELDLPVIIHSRKAEERTIEVLEEEKMKRVDMHCFCGKKRLVKRIADNGWKLSIPANVVKSEQFRMNIDLVPISSLLTETDSPYLSPVPGERNEPWQVEKSIKAIAEIKGLDVEEASTLVFKNYQDLFL